MGDNGQDVERTFADETIRLTAERLVPGALAFMTALGISWVFEHQVHPERDLAFALIYGSEGVCLAIVIWLSWRPQWRRRSRMLAVITVTALIALIGLYHVIAPGEADVAALALLYVLTGTMMLLPWGWQGQLPVALAAVGTYCGVVWMGVPAAMPIPTTLLGLATISAFSVGCAAFLARYRLAFLHQAAELRAANVALEEANQTKNQFLASVSHELRTPLNIIVGYTDLLLEGDFGGLPADARDALERVARNGRSLVYLISDLLDLARIEAGRLEVQLTRVELGAVFADMGQFVEPRLDGKAVRFHAAPPGALAVRADRSRLEQILVNLLSNAVKFTKAGEIQLCVKTPADGRVTIEVSDTGIGIDSAELPLIFQPFAQGAAGKKLGGVGIGLSVSARLAQAMGGELTVSSQVGRGSTFALRLPAG